MDLYSDAARAYFLTACYQVGPVVQCYRCKYRRGAAGCKKKVVRKRGGVAKDILFSRAVCPYKKLVAEPARPIPCRVYGSPEHPL